MIRFSTPTHTFGLPADLNTEIIKTIRVAYSQNGQVVVEKEGAQVRVVGHEAQVKLTQEDTQKFANDEIAEVQMQILTTGGDSIPSQVHKIYVERSIFTEVLA